MIKLQTKRGGSVLLDGSASDYVIEPYESKWVTGWVRVRLVTGPALYEGPGPAVLIECEQNEAVPTVQ